MPTPISLADRRGGGVRPLHPFETLPDGFLHVFADPDTILVPGQVPVNFERMLASGMLVELCGQLIAWRRADPEADPAPMVADQVLRELSRPDPFRAAGKLSPEDHAILCIYLAPLAAELLLYRERARAAQGGGAA